MLTREDLLQMCKCDQIENCTLCTVGIRNYDCYSSEQATEILELLDSCDVWQDAEGTETIAEVFYGTGDLLDASPRKTYIREAIKSKNMLIAEEICELLFDDINPTNIKTILSVLDKKDIK